MKNETFEQSPVTESGVIKAPLEHRFEKVSEPFSQFIASQTSGAVLLILATVLALVLANSDYAELYHHIGELSVGLVAQDHVVQESLHFWVNEGLMVLFFFLLGLEIKREFMVGELNSFTQSITVIMAAVGGMLVPAAIYSLLNYDQPSLSGWGISMATDAAFALGVLVLMGHRVPAGLKVFLVALAIVDDIGAVLVIALFYTEQINPLMLAGIPVFLISLILLNRTGIRSVLPYLLVGLGLWYVTLQSGVHATFAGVIAALAIPARARLHPHAMARSLRRTAAKLERLPNSNPQHRMLADDEKHEALERVERKARESRTVLRSWENYLERPVSLMVVPAFAFLNAGIALSATTFDDLQHSAVGWGILAGLVLGKPLGIVSFSWLTVYAGMGSFPRGVALPHIIGVGLLAGMGFTMSIFIAMLSFKGTPELLLEAKTAIMLATVIAGGLGASWLWCVNRLLPQSESQA